MVEKLFAGLVLVACVLLLVRLSIGERRRWRLDGALRRGWARMRRTWAQIQRKTLALIHWRKSRRAAVEAAEQAIRRARMRADRDGNVYRPKSFDKPPNDKLH